LCHWRMKHQHVLWLFLAQFPLFLVLGTYDQAQINALGTVQSSMPYHMQTLVVAQRGSCKWYKGIRVYGRFGSSLGLRRTPLA
jgi:hypothetical protein